MERASLENTTPVFDSPFARDIAAYFLWLLTEPKQYAAIENTDGIYFDCSSTVAFNVDWFMVYTSDYLTLQLFLRNLETKEVFTTGPLGPYRDSIAANTFDRHHKAWLVNYAQQYGLLSPQEIFQRVLPEGVESYLHEFHRNRELRVTDPWEHPFVENVALGLLGLNNCIRALRSRLPFGIAQGIYLAPPPRGIRGDRNHAWAATKQCLEGNTRIVDDPEDVARRDAYALAFAQINIAPEQLAVAIDRSQPW